MVGKTTEDLRFRVLHQGEEVANLPIKELGDEAPEYDRPYQEPNKLPNLDAAEIEPPTDYNAALMTMLGSPNMASRRWVWEQYDSLIQANTLQIPGGDAGVVRVCAPLAGDRPVEHRARQVGTMGVGMGTVVLVKPQSRIGLEGVWPEGSVLPARVTDPSG